MNSLKKIISKLREGYLKEMYREILWMYPYVRQHRASIGFYIAAGIFGAVLGLACSLVSKNLIDAVVGVQESRIGFLACLMATMYAGNIAANAVISRISARIQVLVQNELQAEIYKKIMDTDWESLQAFCSGDLLNRLNSDVSQVASGVVSWVPNLLIKLVQFLGALGLILYYDPVMAVIALLSAPVTLGMSRILVGRLRNYNKELREVGSELMSFENDSFSHMQTVKAFGLSGLFQKSLERLLKQYEGKMLDYNRFSVYTSSFLSAVGMMVSGICFGWSAYRLWSGYLTVGTMMMFLQMAGSLTASFHTLVQLVPSAINAATCAGRLMEVAELPKEKFREEEASERLWETRDGGISVELHQVEAAYRGRDPVLYGGELQADRGEIVAVVGSSGEGKTTLMRILLGLLYPIKGKAELVGKDGIRCPISSATRRFFGYVPQGNTVFTGTVAENMRMVKEDATEEEIIHALKLGCAWEFIEPLPQGIYSRIGEHGTGFSEGQAQRIAIARAILRDAPVLLLDEATSALDVEVEERVLRNIMECGKKKTCIVTTHRPGVLAISSHIYEIRENHLEKRK